MDYLLSMWSNEKMAPSPELLFQKTKMKKPRQNTDLCQVNSDSLSDFLDFH